MTITVPSTEPGIGRIVRAAFPNNRKPIANSYWDGGSKDEYRLVDLDAGRAIPFPTSHPYFDRLPNGERCGKLCMRDLPPNWALVQGGTFCGKPSSITVYLHPSNITKLISTTVELSDAEQKALGVVASIKSGYRAGEFQKLELGEYGPTNPHIVSLVAKGLVSINRAGSIAVTIAGRNARR
jgi:hypothetical protein